MDSGTGPIENATLLAASQFPFLRNVTRSVLIWQTTIVQPEQGYVLYFFSVNCQVHIEIFAVTTKSYPKVFPNK